ncbi:eukaryotic translation initiation factor 3, subunit 6 [Sistotremastrum niveocremeum HHB9708]|uniref:Eukaryotic translation initiation factor 3 subunit E n=2 Tax=Sistotremastraceae TaxID=3402574 RepID=A0A164XJE0_9AGAM|nr:eukaryotic translation initiation factor 3, subunit 6 [Sistotremastrum niveocremeum HHB9708]KZT44627.1 eukaryotic translation initiation factor 3, subunit 6 [Sistotremastrum suecicum HHB10207 ss-3]
MAEHDLTQKMVPFLDRHLAFPLLAHLSETGLFPDEQVRAAQYELAKGTNMIDYAVGLFEELHPNEPIPDDFTEKRERAVSTNEKLQQEAQAVLDVIENPEVAQALRQDKMQNLAYLKDNYNLSLSQIAALYNFGQFQFSIGNYSGAADYLYHFRILSTDQNQLISAHWGKLASDILSGKWDVALEELNTLRDALPSSSHNDSAALAQLQSRTWLLHWSLFVYFNHPQGRILLLETFLNPTYLNTIQTSCPWILRYLVSAAILSRKSSATATSSSSRVRNAIREVVKIIQMEEYQYSDPITRFLKELYVMFDFEGAQRELSTAQRVIADDFFLNEFKDEFLEHARYLISEAYCRIHQRIDIRDLSERLNLSAEEGEKWIVNLIRDTRMGADAKIDLEKNVIQINRQPLPMYQSVIEKTRGLAFRTQALSTAMGRAQGQSAEPEAPTAVA